MLKQRILDFIWEISVLAIAIEITAVTIFIIIPALLKGWTMFVNGWEITTRLAGTSEEYHIAKKEGHRVHTSKDINYIIRLCTERN